MKVLKGRVQTIWLSKDDLPEAAALGIPPEERDKGRAEIERAESRGFMFCDAVFVDRVYYDLHERGAPDDPKLDWGRGQHVTERKFWRDGKLVPDPEYQTPPPEAKWESHGLRCEIVFVEDLGHRCGYVGVPPKHPLHGVAYNAEATVLRGRLEARLKQPMSEMEIGFGTLLHALAGRDLPPAPEHVFSVHGGITYSGLHDDGWHYFGWDCAHAGDLPSPEVQAYMQRVYGLGEREGHYWTEDEVRRETEWLVEQIASLTGPAGNR